jgi:hypothetical protein
MVNSDDRKLPDGADIIAACQVGTGKVNFMDLTLFLGMSIYIYMYQCKFNHPSESTVTRQKIPTKTILSWNFPKEHDNSSDSDDDASKNYVGINKRPSTSHLPILRSRSRILPNLKDVDTISISSDSSMLCLDLFSLSHWLSLGTDSEISNPLAFCVGPAQGASPMREGTTTPRFPTPPLPDSIADSFTSSLVFDRTIPNPWTTAS